MKFIRSGGDKEDRTPDLFDAIEALSQLSYTPTYIHFNIVLINVNILDFS